MSIVNMYIKNMSKYNTVEALVKDHHRDLKKWS